MQTVVSVFVNDIRGVEGQLLVRVDAHQESGDRCLQGMLILMQLSCLSDKTHIDHVPLEPHVEVVQHRLLGQRLEAGQVSHAQVTVAG